MGREYQGWRSANGDAYVVVDEGNDRQRLLDHVILHSPTGLEWGYAGSGPADTALSILVDYLHEADKIPAYSFRKFDTRTASFVGRTMAGRLYQSFKERSVANFNVPAGKTMRLSPDGLETAMEPKRTDHSPHSTMQWAMGEGYVGILVAAIIIEEERCPDCGSTTVEGVGAYDPKAGRYATPRVCINSDCSRADAD